MQRQPAHLFEPRAVYRSLTGSGRAGDQPPHTGTNPPAGAVIYYSLAEDLPADATLTLEVLAAGTDEAIWTWSRKPGDADEPDDEKPSATCAHG